MVEVWQPPKSRLLWTLRPFTGIDDAAERLAKPKSQIVREAVADYRSRIGRLSEIQ